MPSDAPHKTPRSNCGGDRAHFSSGMSKPTHHAAFCTPRGQTRHGSPPLLLLPQLPLLSTAALGSWLLATVHYAIKNCNLAVQGLANFLFSNHANTGTMIFPGFRGSIS